MSWHTEATQFLFFTGKGGVGKTSLACAMAEGRVEASGAAGASARHPVPVAPDTETDSR